MVERASAADLHGTARADVVALVAAVLVAWAAAPAAAFPPYRSTDADTAPPWTLETRLGLVRVERESSDTSYESPLFRGNFGLPGHVEILTEFSHVPETAKRDLAAGLKWVPYFGPVSAGIEALALLPTGGSSGAGIESLLLATLRSDPLRVHLNAGGFYDPRPDESEHGWKVGLLGELGIGRLRPGLEIFAKGVASEDAQLIAGPGLIIDLGGFDLRTGVHAGLTREAPDVVWSLWITTAIPLGGRGPDRPGEAIPHASD